MPDHANMVITIVNDDGEVEYHYPTNCDPDVWRIRISKARKG